MTIHVKKETQFAKLKELIASATPDGCAIWPFSKRGDGYGQIRTGDGKTDYAHRLAWIFSNGEITNGLFVLHRCDVRACLNPYHLFLGTHTDNMQDAKRKCRFRGGGPLGEKNGRAILKEWQIKNIRELHVHGMTYRQLAKIYKSRPRTIKAICAGQTWKHSEGPLASSLADPQVAWDAIIWDLKEKIRKAEESKKAGDPIPETKPVD